MTISNRKTGADAGAPSPSLSLRDELALMKSRAEDLSTKLDKLESSREVEAKRRQRLDDFASTMNGWFWETDAQLRFIYISPSMKVITGVDPEWHYGKTRYEFGVPESVSDEEWARHLGQLERMEPFSNFVYQRQGPDGLKWLSASGSPYFDAGGEFLGYRGSGFDITEEMETKETAERLYQAIENHDSQIALWDHNELLIFANKQMREYFKSLGTKCAPGVGIEEFNRALVKEGLAPGAAGDEDGWIARRLEHFRTQVPMEVKRPNGDLHLIRDHRLKDGATMTMVADVTDLKRLERELARAAGILTTAMQTIPDGLQVVDKDMNMLAWNDQLFEVMELDREEVLGAEKPGRAFFEIIARRGDYGPGDIDELIESRFRPVRDKVSLHFERQLASGKWIECRGGPIRDGGYVAVYRDIDEAKQATARLRELASVDELTRVSNRRHFLEIAATEFERSRRYGYELTFVMLDIDYFKTINDQHGHAAGDTVLRSVSAVCRETVRDSDKIGRLGGEEFAIMLPETSGSKAFKLAERIRQAIGRAVVDFNGEKLRVTSSFGVAAVGPAHKDVDAVLEAADKALYAAKRGGRNRVVDSATLD